MSGEHIFRPSLWPLATPPGSQMWQWLKEGDTVPQAQATPDGAQAQSSPASCFAASLEDKNRPLFSSCMQHGGNGAWGGGRAWIHRPPPDSPSGAYQAPCIREDLGKWSHSGGLFLGLVRTLHTLRWLSKCFDL